MGAHVELELPTLPEHPSSALVFSGVRVAPSLVFCVVLKFYRSFFFPFSFFHCVVCPSILRILIIPLVSSNSSYNSQTDKTTQVKLKKTKIQMSNNKRLCELQISPAICTTALWSLHLQSMCVIKIGRRKLVIVFIQRVMVLNQQILPPLLVVSDLQAFIDPTIVLAMFMLSHWPYYCTSHVYVVTLTLLLY